MKPFLHSVTRLHPAVPARHDLRVVQRGDELTPPITLSINAGPDVAARDRRPRLAAGAARRKHLDDPGVAVTEVRVTHASHMIATMRRWGPDAGRQPG
jgi:hypothetical protein